MSSLKARRAIARTDRVVMPTMRPLPDQLALLTKSFAEVSKRPMSEPENRATLRALALATVFSIDSMAA